MNLLPNQWTLSDAVIKSNGHLDVGWKAVQSINLIAGKSYSFTYTATNNPLITVRFRTLNGEVFREYSTDFIAPEYAAKAEILVLATRGRAVVSVLELNERLPISKTEKTVYSATSYPPQGYQLVFNDEFEGTALNRSKWFTRMIYAGGTMDKLNDEIQSYRDADNHRVTGGQLALVYHPDTKTSGMIRSDATFRYGYFEARVKMPSGIGIAPAFWLNSDVSAAGQLTWPPEIDIFEFVNNGVEDTVNMLHSGVVGASVLSTSVPAWNEQFTYFRGPDFSAGWHTIGMEWLPDRVSLFVDGVKIYTRSYTWPVTAGRAHIIMNLAMGGQWAGRHGVTDQEQSFLINWVRAYTKVA